MTTQDEKAPECPNCGSPNCRVDNRDRPDGMLDGTCFDCEHDWTEPTPFVKGLFDMMDGIQEIMDQIPEDKDCKKCPHSNDGHWPGMVTPCFDLCAEQFGGSDEEPEEDKPCG